MCRSVTYGLAAQTSERIPPHQPVPIIPILIFFIHPPRERSSQRSKSAWNYGSMSLLAALRLDSRLAVRIPRASVDHLSAGRTLLVTELTSMLAVARKNNIRERGNRPKDSSEERARAINELLQIGSVNHFPSLKRFSTGWAAPDSGGPAGFGQPAHAHRTLRLPSRILRPRT